MNLIERRRQMMMSKSLPYDAEVEYLQSDGHAYIDTGLKGGNDVYFKLTAINYFNQGSLGYWLIGARTANGNKQFGVFINSSTNYVNLAYNSSLIDTLKYYSFPNTSIIEVGNGVIKIGNSSFSYNPSVFQTQYNLILFGLNNAGGMIVRASKIGDTYIKKGSLELDFIPVRVGQVGYMYDRVSGQLFGNQGTGNFVLGPDKTS